MTPRAPRLSTGLSERSVADRERSLGEAERLREEGIADPALPATDLMALRRFSRETELSPRAAQSLRRFQGLPETRAPAVESAFELNPLVWMRRFLAAWRGGTHGMPLFMGLGFLLGEGAGERIRVEGDVTTIRFPEGQRAISIGRTSSRSDANAPPPDLDFSGKRKISHEHAELYRDGSHLYLRDLDSMNGSWIWRKGSWSRIDRKHPAMLERGATVAIGGFPRFQDLAETVTRNGEMSVVVLHIEPAPEPDAVRIRRVKPQSLEYFLSNLDSHGALFAEGRPFSSDGKQWGEHLGLAFRFGMGKSLYRIQVANRLRSQGHHQAALAEFGAAEIALEAALEDLRTGKDGWHQTLVMLLDFIPEPPKSPQEPPGTAEMKVHQALGDLYSDKGYLFQSIQDPENAAFAFGKAAEHWRYLVGSEVQGSRQPSFQYEMNSSLAYRLFFQQAEREYRAGRFAPAALAYEQAARYAEGARRYAHKAVVQKYISPLKVDSPIRLLTKAADSFHRAGVLMEQEYRRVVKKLHILHGSWNGVFR